MKGVSSTMIAMKTIGFGVVTLLCVSLIAACGSEGGNGDGGAAGTSGGAAGSSGTAGTSGGTAGTGGGLRTTVSCNQAATGLCLEYLNFPQESAEQLRMTCTMSGGTAGSACPRTGVTGVCSTPPQNGVTLSTVYYSSAFDPSLAPQIQQACTASGGTWSAS